MEKFTLANCAESLEKYLKANYPDNEDGDQLLLEDSWQLYSREAGSMSRVLMAERCLRLRLRKRAKFTLFRRIWVLVTRRSQQVSHPNYLYP